MESMAEVLELAVKKSEPTGRAAVPAVACAATTRRSRLEDGMNGKDAARTMLLLSAFGVTAPPWCAGCKPGDGGAPGDTTASPRTGFHPEFVPQGCQTYVKART